MENNGVKSLNKLIIISIIGVLIILISWVLLYVFVFNEDNVKKENAIVKNENYTYDNGTLKFMLTGKELGTYECKNKNVDLCYMANYSNEDNFDQTKYIYEDGTEVLRPSEIMYNRFVFIVDSPSKGKDNDIIGYDFLQKKEIGTYKLVKRVPLDANDFNWPSTFVVLKDKNNKYGVLNFEGNIIKEEVPFKYDNVGAIAPYGIVATKDNQSEVYVGGGQITRKFDGEVKSLSTRAARLSVYKDGKYYLYDFRGNLIDGNDIDYLNFYDEFTYLVRNNRFYIYDKDMKSLIDGGLSFEGTNYNNVIKYDANLKELEKKEYINVWMDDRVELNLNVELNGGEPVFIKSYKGNCDWTV
ncbi:MAG: hypothetical protein RR478_01675 [Bacilli bacterium]